MNRLLLVVRSRANKSLFIVVRDYVESRAQVADGKGPGFAELHIKSARIGEGFDGWAPRAARPIRETVFGRNAGDERGDDHVTRAFDAMDRDRGPGGAGGSGRESGHARAAGPKPRTPDVGLGVGDLSSRFRPTTPATL